MGYQKFFTEKLLIGFKNMICEISNNSNVTILSKRTNSTFAWPSTYKNGNWLPQIFYQILICFNLRKKCFHGPSVKPQFSKFENAEGYGNKICTLKEDLPSYNLAGILFLELGD